MLVENILIYLRKSRKDYEFSNEPIEKTLERHEKILQEYSKKTYGSEIPEENILREVVSGDTIADRPKMQEVLSLIENDKYKAVLVLEIERLARGNTIDQGLIAQTFEYTNTVIITPQKIFNLSDELDRSFFEDGLYQSRKYLLYTKKILTRGRIASVKEGKFVGSCTPFGYDKEKIKGEKGYKLIINKEEADIVKLIFQMYVDNKGTQIIANFLNNNGYKARKSNLWTSAMVRNILTSIAVNGKVSWNRRKTVTKIENGIVKKTKPLDNENAIIIDGLHEKIINDELWNTVQNKLKLNHKSKPPTSIKNPLSGIVKCKICGHNMIRRPYNNGYEDTLVCPITGCNVSSDLKLVENKILAELSKIISNYETDYEDEVQNNVPDFDMIIQNIEQEIKKYKLQLEKVYDLFERGIYNENEFKDRRKNTNLLIQEKENYKKQIISEKDSEKNNYYKLIPKIKNILGIYDELDVKSKNELLKSIISECYYFKQDGGRWKKDNINKFVLEIKLKL